MGYSREKERETPAQVQWDGSRRSLACLFAREEQGGKLVIRRDTSSTDRYRIPRWPVQRGLGFHNTWLFGVHDGGIRRRGRPPGVPVFSQKSRGRTNQQGNKYISSFLCDQG